MLTVSVVAIWNSVAAIQSVCVCVCVCVCVRGEYPAIAEEYGILQVVFSHLEFQNHTLLHSLPSRGY